MGIEIPKSGREETDDATGENHHADVDPQLLRHE